MRHDDKRRKQSAIPEQELKKQKEENERKELIEKFGLQAVKRHEKLLRKHDKREQRARAKHFVLVQKDVPALSLSSASRLVLPITPRKAKSFSERGEQQDLFPDPTEEEVALCEKQIADLLDSGLTPSCMTTFHFFAFLHLC